MSELYHITHSGDKGVNENFFGSAGMLMLGLVAGEVKGRKGLKGRAGREGGVVFSSQQPATSNKDRVNGQQPVVSSQ